VSAVSKERAALILRDAVRSLSSGRAARGPVGTAPQDEADEKRARHARACRGPRALGLSSRDGMMRRQARPRLKEQGRIGAAAATPRPRSLSS
jgi:hypothetical protein